MHVITASIVSGGFLLPGVLTILLLAICWQDVRERQVSLLFLLLLIGGCLLRFMLSPEPYFFPLINSFFLLLQGGAIMLYLLLRYRSLRIGKFLGAGDVLFWLACLWCFSPLNFLLFFIASLLGALLLHLLLRKLISHYEQMAIPLAGYQGIFLILAFVLEAVSPAWGTYNDLPLLTTFGIS